MKQLIVLSQKPVIEYSEMEARGLEVSEKIGLMNLDTIEATEENRSVMKEMRANLNKELEVFESQRKMIHDAITKPYKEFTSSYDENIKVLYKSATDSLKSKIDSVESGMLETKKSDINAYFNGAVVGLDFITLEDVGLNIILSASDKKLREQVATFVSKIAGELKVIGTLENNVRVESLYKTNLDLSLSVSTVDSDIKREKQLEEKREKDAAEAREREENRIEQARKNDEIKAIERVKQKKKEAELIEQQRINAEKNAKLNKTKEAADEVEIVENEKKRADEELKIAEQENQRIKEEKEALQAKEQAEAEIHKMSFTVSGNISQLKQIKEFLEELGVQYE